MFEFFFVCVHNGWYCRFRGAALLCVEDVLLVLLVWDLEKITGPYSAVLPQSAIKTETGN